MVKVKRIVDKQPTITRLTSGSGTYSPPVDCIRIKVTMVGGGAGGAGQNNAGGAANGSATTLGTWTVGGGITYANSTNNTVTNTPTITGVSHLILAQRGGSLAYSASGNNNNFGVLPGGTAGGGTVLGNYSLGTVFGDVGKASPANTGNGGSGGGATTSLNAIGGLGGGGGASAVFFVDQNLLASSYSYSIGSGGVGGSGGGDGGSGVIIIEEFYF
jgi:hypothetical protein